MPIDVYIQNEGTLYIPVVTGAITITQQRVGAAGKLSVTVLDDDVLQMTHGNPIVVKEDDATLFYGFIFSLKRSKKDEIQITAYDQVRYLLNKDTYVFEKKSATEMIQMIADDYILQTGELADTGIKLSRVEDNTTLLDMITNALVETTTLTGQLYVFYDNGGKLTLKNIEGMKSTTLIVEETAEDYDFSSSIDRETYNRVKLVHEDSDSGKRSVYIAQSGENINAWGTLQLYETIGDQEDGQAKADGLLLLHNRPSQTLSIKGAFGDNQVRAGTLIPVKLDMGLDSIQHYMLVEQCTHRYDGGHHSMDLKLRGGDYG